MAIYKLTLSASGWTQTTSALWYDTNQRGKVFDDSAATNEVTSIVPPTRELYRFDGFRATVGGVANTVCINADGTFAQGLADLIAAPATGAKTLTVWQTQVTRKITLNLNGGSGGVSTLYRDYTYTSGGPIYSDWLCENVVTSIAGSLPTRVGYDFTGFFNSTSGTTKYVDANGDILDPLRDNNVTSVYAHWAGHQHTLTFDYNGGTGSTASKTVTFGSAIGTLPTATSPKGDFVEWQVNGTQITSTTVWNIDADASAVAKWNYIFGRVVDYFNLGNANLVPISSSSGDGKRRTCTANANWSSGSQNGGAGRYSSGVNDIGGIWRNPSVTYKVVGDCTVSLNLGQAFAATKSGSTMTISGWMIVSVRVQTSVGAFPTVTVSAVANEGANAINLFAVSIPVKARARAQNLLDAVSGGGNLLTSDMEAACTPVVCAEDNMPCASDVVQGKYTVRATTYAPNNEAAPAAAGGFVSIGEPKFCGDKEYMMWEMTAEKEIT